MEWTNESSLICECRGRGGEWLAMYLSSMGPAAHSHTISFTPNTHSRFRLVLPVFPAFPYVPLCFLTLFENRGDCMHCGGVVLCFTQYWWCGFNYTIKRLTLSYLLTPHLYNPWPLTLCEKSKRGSIQKENVMARSRSCGEGESGFVREGRLSGLRAVRMHYMSGIIIERGIQKDA